MKQFKNETKTAFLKTNLVCNVVFKNNRDEGN